MTLWMLEGYDTDTRTARCREYTTSQRLAEDWRSIPRIVFTDSGHGIVFTARPLAPPERRKPLIQRLDHATEYLRLLAEERRQKRRPGVGILERLRDVNVRRMRRWPGEEDWTGADWSNAMNGEAGEAANVVKKLRRHETGSAAAAGSVDDLRAALAKELADTICYADLTANHYGIDLARAVRDKFNEVSERNGFPERL